MKGWLNDRKWKSSELKSKLIRKMNIDLCVSFADNEGQETGFWEASYSPLKNLCTQERIKQSGSILEVSGGKITISENEKKSAPISFDYEGSILSALKEELLPQPILESKKLMKDVKSLELLSPEYLRQKTRESSGSLGLGGQMHLFFMNLVNQDAENCRNN